MFQTLFLGTGDIHQWIKQTNIYYVRVIHSVETKQRSEGREFSFKYSGVEVPTNKEQRLKRDREISHVNIWGDSVQNRVANAKPVFLFLIQKIRKSQ